jgi:hypothetical protein
MKAGRSAVAATDAPGIWCNTSGADGARPDTSPTRPATARPARSPAAKVDRRPPSPAAPPTGIQARAAARYPRSKGAARWGTFTGDGEAARAAQDHLAVVDVHRDILLDYAGHVGMEQNLGVVFVDVHRRCGDGQLMDQFSCLLGGDKFRVLAHGYSSGSIGMHRLFVAPLS